MIRLIFILCSMLTLFACGQDHSKDGEGALGAEEGVSVRETGSGVPLPSDQSIQIVYSSNLNGEIEPCGCTIDTDYGGLARRATAIEELKQQNPELVLISGGGLLDALSPNDIVKGRFIIEGMSMLPYDAIGAQWVDFTFGEELLKQYPLPLTSFNYPGSVFSSYKEIVRGKLTIAFFSLLNPLKYSLMGGEKAFSEQSVQITKALKQAKKEGKLTVLSTQANLEWLQVHDVLKFVDVFISPGRDEFFQPPKQERNTIILTPGHRGMRLGQLDLITDAKGALEVKQHNVIELDNKVADAASMNDWYDSYNKSVRAHFLKLNEKKKLLAAGESQFAGVDTCKTCHQEAYTIWSGSRHSGAMATLEAVNKHFDPYCLQCHVVGLHEEDGFMDKETTPQFANVQCENCHGAGQAHTKNPVAHDMVLPNPEKDGSELVCLGCHNKSHSPKFDFEEYWPKIKH